jgi:hypothetical protein
MPGEEDDEEPQGQQQHGGIGAVRAADALEREAEVGQGRGMPAGRRVL